MYNGYPFHFQRAHNMRTVKALASINQDNGMYMQEYTPTLEIQVKSNEGQCGILIFVEAFRWTLKLHLYIYICL